MANFYLIFFFFTLDIKYKWVTVRISNPECILSSVRKSNSMWKIIEPKNCVFDSVRNIGIFFLRETRQDLEVKRSKSYII